MRRDRVWSVAAFVAACAYIPLSCLTALAVVCGCADSPPAVVAAWAALAALFAMFAAAIAAAP